MPNPDGSHTFEEVEGLPFVPATPPEGHVVCPGCEGIKVVPNLIEDENGNPTEERHADHSHGSSPCPDCAGLGYVPSS